MNPDTPAETITVIVDGKEVSVAEGKKVSALTVPEKEGFTFEGWYADEGCTVALDSGTVLTAGMHAYAKFAQAPAQEDGDDKKEFWEDLPVIAIAICGIGAIIAVAGLRYHPVILPIGAVIIVIGGLDIGGIISLF